MPVAPKGDGLSSCPASHHLLRAPLALSPQDIHWAGACPAEGHLSFGSFSAPGFVCSPGAGRLKVLCLVFLLSP